MGAASNGKGGELADDPVVASMTISYVLPDGTECVAEEPCVVMRQSGAIPVAWESPPHPVVVNQAFLRRLVNPESYNLHPTPYTPTHKPTLNPKP